MTPTQAFAQAREFLMAHREDYEAAYRGFDWPKLDQFNWALDWFDVLRRRATTGTALWVVGEDGGEHQAVLPRAVRALEPGRQLPARPGRAPRRPHPADAEQRRAAVGGDAGVDQAGRRGHPGDDAAGARRPARPVRARRRPPRRRRRGRTPASSPTSRATTRASSSAARAAAGPACEDAYARQRRVRAGRADAGRTIRCCSTSPPAPPRSRSWSSTATRAIRSAICRRCTGSG